MTSARAGALPRLVVAAWAVAFGVVVVVGVAAWRYLRAGSDSMSGMHHHGASAALTRAGSVPGHPLLGSGFGAAPLFTSWHLDAIAVALVVLAAAAYLTGVALVPVRAPGTSWPVLRTLSFFAGLFVIVFATNGSIAVYDQVLFTAHMAGHLALVMLAPVLLICGRPLRLTLAATSGSAHDRIARIALGRVVSFLTVPPVALASYTAVIVGSHLTGVMDTVMRNTWAGQLEHLVYLLVGCQFFVLVVGDEPIRWRLAAPARWLLLAVAMAVDTFTGIVLMQGTRVVDMLRVPQFQVDRLSDTHTGGAIMWLGGDAIMAVVMIALVMGWLRSAESGAVEEGGWLEQARRAAFAENTGTAENATPLDADDAARDSYNAWLQSLDKRG